MNCEPADDAFLIAHFPDVVQAVPGTWTAQVVALVDPVAGEFGLEVNGIFYPATPAVAFPPDTANTARDKLKAGLAQQDPIVVAVSSLGTDSLQLKELSVGFVTSVLAVVPSDPAGGNIAVTQTVPQDNQEERERWLTRARCWVDCRWFSNCDGCEEFKLVHAAYAAWAITRYGGLFGSGTSSGSGGGIDAGMAKKLRLGPAEIDRIVNGNATPSEDVLMRNKYGELVLARMKARVPTFLASGGPSRNYPLVRYPWTR